MTRYLLYDTAHIATKECTVQCSPIGIVPVPFTTQGPCCSQRNRAWGFLCRAYNGDTSFSELDAGDGLITTATVAEIMQ